jgi:hypothetical protein
LQVCPADSCGSDSNAMQPVKGFIARISHNGLAELSAKDSTFTVFVRSAHRARCEARRTRRLQLGGLVSEERTNEMTSFRSDVVQRLCDPECNLWRNKDLDCWNGGAQNRVGLQLDPSSVGLNRSTTEGPIGVAGTPPANVVYWTNAASCAAHPHLCGRGQCMR